MARSALLLALALTAMLCASAAHTGGPAKGPAVAAHQGKPAAPQGKQAAPQGKPAAPQGKPAAPQGKPAAPQGKPAPAAAPQGKPAAPEVKPAPAAAPAAKPAVPETKPAPADAHAAKPAAPEAKPAAAAANATAALAAAAPVNATTAGPANATAAPANATAVPAAAPKAGEPAKAPAAQAAAPNATATARAPAPKAPTTPAAPPSCATIKGCKSCQMVPVRRRGQQLSCTACEGPNYVLTGRGTNFCACAAGYSAHTTNGTLTGNCTAVPKGWVAASAPPNHPAGNPKLCGPGSAPDQHNGRCLCAPGYYQLLQGGQTPRCVACPPTLYNDVPNTRMACKICPLGKVANAAGTGCVPLATALTETNQIINENLAAVKSAVNPTIAKINSTLAETLQGLPWLRRATAEDQAAFEAPPPKPVKASLKLGSAATEGFTMVPAAGQVVANTASGPAAAGAANGTLKLESAALPSALLNATAAAQAAALNATAAKAGLALPALPVPSAVLAAQKAAADKAANGTTAVLGGRKVAPPAPGKRARKGFDLSSLFGSRMAGLKDIAAPNAVHAAGVPVNGTAATDGAAVRRSAWAGWLASRSKKAAGKTAAAGEDAEEEEEEDAEQEESPDDGGMLGKWVSPDGAEAPKDQPKKAAPPPKKNGKKSGGLTKWQQLQINMSEKGILLPTWQSLTGAVPAMEVPGLEKGAATPALAVGKMLWALANNQEFRDTLGDVGRGAAEALASGGEVRH